jgi:D-glycero-D-manno-heptose 1,7-bisphosphate phosphatase
MNAVVAGEGPVVFIDRDGVIIRNRADYVKSWSEVELMPGALDAMAKLHRNGYRVVVITNQSAIGRGVVPSIVVDDIHRRLAARIEEAGGRIEAFFVCPHAPDDQCSCRKPNPGLLRAAKRHMNVESSAPYMIGDQISDVEAALGAGCRPILLTSFADEPPVRGAGSASYGVAPDLARAVDFLILCEEEIAPAD